MLVSLTIVRYRKAFVPFALLAMALHRLPLWLNRGCTFWKLLGCGHKGSFDLNPDWRQWGLLAVWKDQVSFNRFNKNSFIARWWQWFTAEQWTILCEPLQSHGLWDKQQPFGTNHNKDYTGPVAVLTRATIKLSKAKAFWANVDEAASPLSTAPGYVTSVGIGEAPVLRQATFSVWQSVDDVKAFAYRSRNHADVIKKTRTEGWYSEEMFARFKPLAAWGTLHGKDPLNGLLNKTTT
ncbi:hypothetical protein GCM10027037_08790 [Mucilaginibacter koreensis]